MDEVLNKVADFIFSSSQDNIISNKSVDSGFLLKSGNVERDFLHKKIIYSAPYAAEVEYGRHPGTMPPVETLQKWASRKLGLSPKEARSAGWAIAQGIKKNGIKPRPYVQPAIDAAQARFI